MLTYNLLSTARYHTRLCGGIRERRRPEVLLGKRSSAQGVRKSPGGTSGEGADN